MEPEISRPVTTHIRLTHAVTGVALMLPIAGTEFAEFKPPPPPAVYVLDASTASFEAIVDGFEWSYPTYFGWYEERDGNRYCTAHPIVHGRTDFTRRVILSVDDPRRTAALAAHVNSTNEARIAEWMAKGGNARSEVVTARNSLRHLVVETIDVIEVLLRFSARHA